MGQKGTPTTKRDEIIRIEQEIRKKWKTEIRRNSNLKKKFITFCMPYQNGTLHLGHAYTISKAMFISEFYRINGYNVLFPFAFHGTGLPIYICAAKLKSELEQYQFEEYDSLPTNTQIRILLEMKVPKDKLYLFTDPNYWIYYFPIEVERDVTDFGARVDFTRSFVTTQINPYYDSFVTWQFRKLIAKGLVTYGKRYIIYSIKDGQPCADHDRSSGEGVEPKSYPTRVIQYITAAGNLVNVIATCRSENYEDKQKGTNYMVNEVSFNPEENYVIFEYEGKRYIVREYAYQNISHQMEGTKFVCDFNFSTEFSSGCIESSGTYSIPIQSNLVAKKSTGFIVNADFDQEVKFIYYEPERTVISRSGDICITALTAQWFINYGDENLTKQVNEYITKEFSSPDSAVTNQLLSCSNWIREWPCSRNYGLGTLLPGTDQMIDSLSDSTIYMAYYTIAHLIKYLPIEYVDDPMWDYVFGFSETISKVDSKYTEIIKEMREEFKYWYPVDVRVSGKDLIPNHLTMCLYNHIAIWNKDYCPRSYAINGYQMLNGEKMSKHTGNFMTLRDAIERYGSDPVRLSLAECDGIDDADFRYEIANGNILKLSYEREWFINMIDKVPSGISQSKGDNIWGTIFDNEIKMCMNKVYNHYSNYRFRKAVYDGFHVALSNRDTYIKLCENGSIEPNYILIHKSMSSILLMIYPICPHFVEHLWKYAREKGVPFIEQWHEGMMSISIDDYNYYRYYKDVINNIVDTISRENIKISKNKRNNQPMSIKISIIDDYTKYEKQMIQYVRNFYHTSQFSDKSGWRKFINEFTRTLDGREQVGECGRFMSYVKSNFDIYGNIWYKCISDTSTQNEIIKEWVPIFIKDYKVKDIQFIDVKSNERYQYRNGPGKPEIIFSYK